MASKADVLISKNGLNGNEIIGNNDLTVKAPSTNKNKEKIYGVIFLSAVTGISALIGFGTTLVAARKKDPKYFEDGVVRVKGASESGASLALRALGWGSIYAISGCGILFYGIWKLSGASDIQEFRYKMGSILPKIPRNNPPQSRTEFEGLTDLLTYISEDWVAGFKGSATIHQGDTFFT